MRTLLTVGISLSVIIASVFAFSHRESVPLADSRLPVDNMNITDLTPSGAGLLAAGELGHILLSTDEGKSWQATNIETKRHALITRMAFKDQQNGLAVGHEGWILRTEDGGNNWQEVRFDDKNSDPLLDVKLQSNGQWLAIGAFGKMLSSNDGLTWQVETAPNNTDWHLNGIIGSDNGRMLMIGEAGTIFKRQDLNQTWQHIPEFYTGSFYGGLHLGGSEWLVYGMRGNIYKSRDDGQSWQKVPFNIPVSLFNHIRLSDQRILLVGQGGFMFESSDNGDTFKPLTRTNRGTITDVEQLQNGNLVLSSDEGVFLQPLPKQQASNSKNDGVKS